MTMKNITHLFLALILPLVTSLNAALDTGYAAPDFTLTYSTGVEHSLSDFAGKYVVL